MILNFEINIKNQFKILDCKQEDLDLSNNRLGERNHEIVIEVIKEIPSTIVSLNLSHNNFSKFNFSQFVNIIKSISKDIKILNLSSNNLGKYSGKKLAELLLYLPINLEDLDISNNNLNNLEKLELKTILSKHALPIYLSSFASGMLSNYLIKNNLYPYNFVLGGVFVLLGLIDIYLNRHELSNIDIDTFADISGPLALMGFIPSVCNSFIYNNHTNLTFISTSSATLFSAALFLYKYYNLSNNQSKIYKVLENIPKQIKSLKVNGIEITHKNEQDWLEILSKLPSNVINLESETSIIKNTNLKLQQSRIKAFNEIQKNTPFNKDLSGLILSYATNTSNFWYKKNKNMYSETEQKELSNYDKMLLL